MPLRLRPLREDEIPSFVAASMAGYRLAMVEEAGLSAAGSLYRSLGYAEFAIGMRKRLGKISG